MTNPAPGRAGMYWFAALSTLMLACLLRLWVMPMTSSLWVDEMVTSFVVRFPHDPSFAVAPQVPASVYYSIPRALWNWIGASEETLRAPSLVAMLMAIWVIALIARKTISPRAGWLAVFLCLTLHWFNYFAIDARPYGLGIAVSSASVLFLIRWFDEGRWTDALLFTVLAAALWRIHLLYWPFYLVYAIYGAARLARPASRASRLQIATVLIAICGASVPVVRKAAELMTGAQAHVFNPAPTILSFLYMVHLNVVVICGGLAAIVFGYVKGRVPLRIAGSSWALFLCWWLLTPACIFGYSLLSGNGIFISRYVSLMYPGIALVATALVARLVPERAMRPAAVIAGVTALLLMGQWTIRWPRHEISDWRTAASFERRLADNRTPVLCVSPFIEAQTPAWTPGYPLSSFLYSHLSYYPMRGSLKPLPFTRSLQSDLYAGTLLKDELIPSGRFLLYGPLGGSENMLNYLSSRPELFQWQIAARQFGDVLLVEFRAPDTAATTEATLRK